MENRDEKLYALYSFWNTTNSAIKLGITKMMKDKLVNNIDNLKLELLEELIVDIKDNKEIVNIQEKIESLQIINEINQKAMNTALAKSDKSKQSQFLKDSEHLHELTMDLQKMLLKGE